MLVNTRCYINVAEGHGPDAPPAPLGVSGGRAQLGRDARPELPALRRDSGRDPREAAAAGAGSGS